jgi:hypothetical protein
MVSTRSVAGGTFEHRAGQPESEDLGNEHGNRLTEHRRFGLDAANAPPHHTKSIHHRRMRVGADQRVGETERTVSTVGCHDDAGQVFEIHLVNDAGIRRHDAEVVERVLAPPQKRVALLVARELELRVELKGVRLAEVVDLHGMVDDELDRLQRVHAIGVAAEAHDTVAHRGQVDHRRHTGEVLQQHPRGGERDFLLCGALEVPRGHRLRCRPPSRTGRLHGAADSRAGPSSSTEGARPRESSGLQCGQAVHLRPSIADRDRRPRSKAVHGRHQSNLKKRRSYHAVSGRISQALPGPGTHSHRERRLCCLVSANKARIRHQQLINKP